jgi:type IX secretion system PorP/SprF family membrane protein
MKPFHCRKIFMFFLGMCLFFSSKGQDLHYSQFYNSPQNINPALVGVFNGDHRFTASMRDQWRFVPVPWFTFSGTYDRKFYPKKTDKYMIGAGALINHDRQGDSHLNYTSIIGSGAFHYFLKPEHIVSGGLQLGIASRGFNYSNLTWDKQWDNDVFNPNIDPLEKFKNLERVTFVESSAGFNYRYQKHSRTYLDAGIAILHLVKPASSFYSVDNIKIPSRISYSLQANIKVLPKLDVQLHALHQTQNVYNETLFGGLGKIYINQKRGKEYQLHVGIGHRTSGSWFPTVALQVNQYYASFSYDIDNTNFNKVLASKRGGPELHFRYIIANVRPLNKFKNCPIY